MFKGGGRDFEKIYYRRHGKTMGGFQDKKNLKIHRVLFIRKNNFQKYALRREPSEKDF